MPEPKPAPKHDKDHPHLPPQLHHDIPSPILKELLELKRKMENLEGMMEMLLKQTNSKKKDNT